MQSPDSSAHTPADQGAQSMSLRVDGATEKTGAVPKVPKSVSAGALSLMIPGGKWENTRMHAENCDLSQLKSVRAVACQELQERQTLNR